MMVKMAQQKLSRNHVTIRLRYRVFSKVMRKVVMLPVTQSPNEAGKDLGKIPGTIWGTIGKFVQFVYPVSPLESTMRP